ncbi:hypothetical protein Sango_2463200 [Sesamum angolense]|uniref:RNase H type-1 domain-containing protein n=1 Tax=Sesamum angolense TaxID=2727404 RepID=A0AAE2BKD1_9LAMI|nr:hypothetical protein Sango_2463200 [Sesamum angolense]
MKCILMNLSNLSAIALLDSTARILALILENFKDLVHLLAQKIYFHSQHFIKWRFTNSLGKLTSFFKQKVETEVKNRKEAQVAGAKAENKIKEVEVPLPSKKEEGSSLGLRVVARNSHGVCLAWLSIRINRRGPTLLAETFGAREAILLAYRRSRQKVTIEGDYATLIFKFSLGSSDHSVFGPLVVDIVSFAAQLESVSFSFIHRSGNSVAHFLAQLTLNLEGDSSNVPFGVHDLLFGEFANLI